MAEGDLTDIFDLALGGICITVFVNKNSCFLSGEVCVDTAELTANIIGRSACVFGYYIVRRSGLAAFQQVTISVYRSFFNLAIIGCGINSVTPCGVVAPFPVRLYSCLASCAVAVLSFLTVIVVAAAAF